jgi:hypothetical protein
MTKDGKTVTVPHPKKDLGVVSRLPAVDFPGMSAQVAQFRCRL